MGWEEFKHDLRHGALIGPVLNLFNVFMDLERGSRFPFYTFPWAKKFGSETDIFINFVDNAIDAHEDERNSYDANRNFHLRSYYMYDNLWRHQNDTMANLIFSTQIPKNQYDKVQTILSTRTTIFYVAASTFHSLSFMSLCYFFRYRKVTLFPCAIIAGLYQTYFTVTNKLMYKLIVDSKVNSVSRSLGHERYVQPVGTFRPLDY